MEATAALSDVVEAAADARRRGGIGLLMNDGLKKMQ
jgi:hypothetical protein